MRPRILLLPSLMICFLPRYFSAELLVTGYHFEDNLLKDRFGPENGYATVKTSNVPDQLSTCFKTNVRFDRFGNQVGYLDFTKEGETVDPFTQIVAKFGSLTVDGIITWKFKKIPEVNNRLKWISFCLSFDYTNDKASLYINGKKIPNPSKQLRPVNGKMSAAKNVGLVVRIGHYYFDNKPMIGRMVDVHVWSRYLTKEEGVKYSSCAIYVEKTGDLINQNTKWNITGSLIKKIEVPIKEVLCTPENIMLTLYIHVPFLRFTEAKETCDKYLDGSVIGPLTSNDGDWRRFHEGGNANPAVVSLCWTGGRILHWMPYVDMDGKLDGKYNFTHTVTNEPMGAQLSPWRPKQPNDKKPPHCTYSYLGLQYNVSWYDMPCVRDSWQWAGCVGCWIPNTFENSVVIKMRGLCQRSQFDTEYQVRNGENGFITYIGKRSTEIKYLGNKMQWVMTLVNDESVSAVSEAPMSSLMMGNHQWTIKGDTLCQKQETQMMLSLTTCTKEQFTCNSGLCIDILSRCNSYPDCNDKSDEIGCRKVALDSSYQKFIAPPPNQNEVMNKVSIGVSADLLRVLAINEVASIFHVQFILHFSWFDSRLRFENLKNDTGLNSLMPLERESIWIPELVFENTEYKPSTILDSETSITVEKKGIFSLSAESVVENVQYFAGNENPLILSRFYNTQFLCDYDMNMYPFDIQKCTMVLSMKGKSGDFAQLRSKLLKYLGPTDLQQYFIKKYVMNVTEKEEKIFLEIDVTLGRRLLSIILTVFIPTFLLNVISHSTNFFKIFFFEAIVTINLTTMLVLMTLFISVSDGLPKTAYIKMIDIWLVFNLLVPFVEIMLHTYMDTLRESKDENKKEDSDDLREINHHGKVVKVDKNGKILHNDHGGKKNSISSISDQPFTPVDCAQDTQKNGDDRPATSYNSDLVARDEKKEVAAREQFYKKTITRQHEKLKYCLFMANAGIPCIALIFMVLYWIIGLNNYYSKF